MDEEQDLGEVVWQHFVKEAVLDQVGISLSGTKFAGCNKYPRDHLSLFVYGEYSDAVQKRVMTAFSTAMAAHNFVLPDG